MSDECNHVDVSLLETSDWKGLRDDPLCARARKLLSFEEFRAIMRHAREYEKERYEGTLNYLRTQARNGTLHPQVVIQNIDKLLGPPRPVSRSGGE